MFGSYLKEPFSEHFVILTDGSVHSNRTSATAAIVIPALKYECVGKLSFEKTSTAELAAVQLALPQLL